MTHSLFTSQYDCTAEIAVAKDDILLLSTAHYNNSSRHIAHKLKEGDYNAIVTAAYRMAACLPENCILIPAPGRNGYATQTLKLAKMISRISGAQVADVLKGCQRMANYDAKKQGHPLKMDDLGLYLAESIPADKTAVIIDNVVDTGTTAFAAANLIGSCIVLSYAMTGVLS
ncbi:MAG: phosphoribosyltransferase [Prevotella sp.]|nr:phosphoribosyltransferase [Candidatus Prevotella equi]